MHGAGDLEPEAVRSQVEDAAGRDRQRLQLLRVLQRQRRRWRAARVRAGRAEEGGRLAESTADGTLFNGQVGKKNGLPNGNYRCQGCAWEQLQRTVLDETPPFSDNAA